MEVISNNAIFHYLDTTKPTDRIVLSFSAVNDLFSLLVNCGRTELDENGKDAVGVHSDIFFAGIVPLTDCEIQLDEDSEHVCRVSVFPDYSERIDMANASDVTVGVIQIGNFVASFSVESGEDTIGYNDIFDRNGHTFAIDAFNSGNLNIHTPHKDVVMSELFLWCISIWYGVQIALLHPLTQDIFKNPQRMPYEKSNKQVHKTKKKHTVRYIRHHVINPDDIKSKIFSDESNQIHRKTMVWYQIGHWRKCHNGKIVFVSPCWKGPLRETKMIENARSREVIVNNPNHKQSESEATQHA